MGLACAALALGAAAVAPELRGLRALPVPGRSPAPAAAEVAPVRHG
jgi:hypothetical protein